MPFTSTVSLDGSRPARCVLSTTEIGSSKSTADERWTSRCRGRWGTTRTFLGVTREDVLERSHRRTIEEIEADRLGRHCHVYGEEVLCRLHAAQHPFGVSIISKYEDHDRHVLFSRPCSFYRDTPSPLYSRSSRYPHNALRHSPHCNAFSSMTRFCGTEKGGAPFTGSQFTGFLLKKGQGGTTIRNVRAVPPRAMNTASLMSC